MMHCVTVSNAQILYNSVMPNEIISLFWRDANISFFFPKSSAEWICAELQQLLAAHKVAQYDAHLEASGGSSVSARRAPLHKASCRSAYRLQVLFLIL